jgi:hypothetical protein
MPHWAATAFYVVFRGAAFNSLELPLGELDFGQTKPICVHGSA